MGYKLYEVTGSYYKDKFGYGLYSGDNYRKALRVIKKNRKKFDLLTLEIRDDKEVKE